jgi:hypothetical protein
MELSSTNIYAMFQHLSMLQPDKYSSVSNFQMCHTDNVHMVLPSYRILG